ncbi:MAG TPA: Zn-dependent hydrolase [Xanthomonadales bacterium]|nr:Zn-dependent hydrolase [Xanthomonadales bacterium]
MSSLLPRSINQHWLIPLLLLTLLGLSACQRSEPEAEQAAAAPVTPEAAATPASEVAQEPADPQPSRYDIYATVRLTADLSHLTENQRKMIPLLIEASAIMDELFWKQSYGDKEALLSGIQDPVQRRFAEINYGPWDRLAGEQPFIESAGEKPLGSQFYPTDMSKEEFEAWQQPGKDGLYSIVTRDANGALQLVPYSQAFAAELQRAGALLRQAAELADDQEFSNYLLMRAHALETDDYQPSDMAWMDMKNNPIELVIGAIETYEDRLYGYRAAYEGYVLIKDLEWSERLARFAAYLPELQTGLPVADEYKAEVPGSDADLNAYDVVYYAGHCNAGSKTIAINLPNDEQVQLEKGTRRMQLKNAMLAKYNQIMIPIADMLIADDQRQHITFDSFFGNTMFHEVAHGLGIKNTLDGSNTVRQALKEHYSALEEGKADILGLYMVQKLREKGEITDGELMDDYVTFMAGIFRSVRFGASSAHGQANMIRFNFFEQAGAFSRDAATGKYRINVPEFEKAVEDLSRTLLTLQGNGDYAAVDAFVVEKAGIGSQLQSDLDRLAAASIPVDIVFEQGVEVLGLAP